MRSLAGNPELIPRPGSRGHRLRFPARPRRSPSLPPSLPVGKGKSQGHDFSLGPSHGERAWLTVPHTAQPSLAPGVSAHVHMPADVGEHLAPVAPGASSAAPGQRSPRDSPRRHVLPGRFIPSTLTAGSCRQPDGADTSPAARLQPVTLPVVLPAGLETRMAPFPGADCLEVAQASYTHRHLWVCWTPRGVLRASSFPDPCSSFGFSPLVLYPRMFLRSS